MKRIIHFLLLIPVVLVTWPFEYHDTGAPLIWDLRDAWAHTKR